MKKKSPPPIDNLRRDIDQIDAEILSLISKRGKLAKEIGHIKKSAGIEIYVPSREKQIFDRLSKLNRGPYVDTSIFSIFREVISATRALEQPTRIAFLGPIATFTHMAAVNHFGSSASFLPQGSIADVFSEVEKQRADYGVVPIENSTEGVVNYTLDKFVESDLKICSEIIISVSHNLLSAESDVTKIKTVYSHPQALSQCRQWLTTHLPKAKLKETESTALAAKKIIKEKGAAAIASQLAGDLYGLNLLVRDIQDQSKNYTRFLVIGQDQAELTGRDKTSLAFVAKDRVGVLFHLLKPLAENQINLTKIESRPLKKRAWEYMFFIDLDGHANEKRIQSAIERLKNECEFFKILGSYPKTAQAS
jgi:chorismate mutase/prephenate dehydratase